MDNGRTRLYNVLMGNPASAYNNIGRASALSRQTGSDDNFFTKRAKSLENAFGTTGAALTSFIDTGIENQNIEDRNKKFKENMNDIYKKYGYNSADDYYNAKDEAEKLFDKYGFNSEDYWNKHAEIWSPDNANSDEVKALEKTREDAINRMSKQDADKIRYFENIQNELKGQSAANANEAKKASEDWKNYRENSYVGQKINQDRGKFAGSAINTLSTMSDVLLPGAGVAFNAAQGGIEGIADELEQNGLNNFNWERAGQNALTGAVSGGVVGGLNKGLSGALAKNGGNLFKGGNKLTQALNNLGSNTALGRAGATVATGAGRGALSGAVGGATGAGLSAAMNGQDVLGSALQGAVQGAQQGAIAGGTMAGANMAISKTPGVGNVMKQLNEAGENWEKSGKDFNERLTNTLTSGDSRVGDWLQGKTRSKLLASAGQIGDTIRDYTDAGMGPRKAEAAAYEDLLKSYNEDRGLQGAIDDARAAGLANDTNFQRAQKYVEGGSMAITPEDAFNDLKSVYGDSFKESTYKNKDGSWKYRNGEPYVWTTYKNKIAMNLSKAMDAADAGKMATNLKDQFDAEMSNARNVGDRVDIKSDYLNRRANELQKQGLTGAQIDNDEVYSYIRNTADNNVPADVRQRLDYLRNELDNERISYGELAELQNYAPEIIKLGDERLAEAAGIPEADFNATQTRTMTGRSWNPEEAKGLAKDILDWEDNATGKQWKMLNGEGEPWEGTRDFRETEMANMLSDPNRAQQVIDALNKTEADLRYNENGAQQKLDNQNVSIQDALNSLNAIRSKYGLPTTDQTPNTLGGWLKKAGQRIVEDANNRGMGMSIKNVGNEPETINLLERTSAQTPETQVYRALSGETQPKDLTSVFEPNADNNIQSRNKLQSVGEQLQNAAKTQKYGALYDALDAKTAARAVQTGAPEKLSQLGISPENYKEAAKTSNYINQVVSDLAEKSGVKVNAPDLPNRLSADNLDILMSDTAVKKYNNYIKQIAPDGATPDEYSAGYLLQKSRELGNKAANLRGNSDDVYALRQALTDAKYKLRNIATDALEGSEITGDLTNDNIANGLAKMGANEKVQDYYTEAVNGKAPSVSDYIRRSALFEQARDMGTQIDAEKFTRSASKAPTNPMTKIWNASGLDQPVNALLRNTIAPIASGVTNLAGKALEGAGNVEQRIKGNLPAVTSGTDTTPTYNPDYNPQTRLYNAIGRTEGLTNAEQARTANYLANAAQEAEIVPNNTLEGLASTQVPNTTVTSMYESAYGQPTAQQTVATGKSYFPTTGDYWTDTLGRAMTSAIDANDATAFGSLYEMYQDAVAKLEKQNSSTSEQKLTATQQRANAAMNSLDRLSGMTPDLGYNLSNIPVIGDIATFGGNDYESEAQSLAQQIGYMVSGANIKEEEAANIGKAYVPQPWDSEQTRRLKLQRAREIIQQYQNGMAGTEA